jgi:AraC-like DNA-binding protein
MQILAHLPERRARVRLQRSLGADYTIAWASDWDELERLVREMAIDVFVVDPRRAGRVDVAAVCRLRERYPSVPAVLYTEFRIDLADPLLEWGDAGVCGAIFLDQSDSDWDLHRILEMAVTRSAAQQLLSAIEAELPELGEDGRRVLSVGLYEATNLQTVEQWARRVGLSRRALYRLFDDAGLPTPKTCLQWLRLLYAAKALSDPGVSVEDVVFRMRYSAPPNFWAHVRKMLGITPSEMRWSITPEELADKFAAICRRKTGAGDGEETETA